MALKNWFQNLGRRAHWLVAFILLVISALLYAPITDPLLFSDDWGQILLNVFGQAKAVNFASRRPFEQFIFVALYQLFGLQIQWYYLVNLVVTFFSALMVYWIIRKAFHLKAWLAFPVALLFLVYPADYSRNWIIMIYIHCVLLISLGVIWLLLDYAATGRGWELPLIFLGTAIPLGAYEAQLGLLFVTAGLLAVFTQGISLPRRAAIASLVLVAVAFVFWRLYWQPTVLKIEDFYAQSASNANPLALIQRMSKVIPIMFGRSWVDPFRLQLKIGSALPAVGIALLIIILVVLPDLVNAVRCRLLPANRSAIRPNTQNAQTANKTIYLGMKISFSGFLPQIKMKTRSLSRLISDGEAGAADESTLALWTPLIFGIIYTFAGFIPMVTVYAPNLNSIGSRANQFATPGAALTVVYLIYLFVRFFQLSAQRTRLAVYSALLPLVLIGVIIQLWNQSEAQTAWTKQKQVWNAMFETVPNIKDNTTVVFVIAGYKDPLRVFQHRPFVVWWETHSELQILYNNLTLTGRFYYKDAPEVWEGGLIHENGVADAYDTIITPFKDILFVMFSPDTNQMIVVKDPTSELGLPFNVTGYDPEKHIIAGSKPAIQSRILVK